MAAPFSVRFFLGLVHSSSSPVVAVPENFVWVVRSIDSLLTLAGQQGAAVIVNGSTYLWVLDATIQGHTQSWRGRQVLNAGDQLSFHSGNSDAFFMCSGYQLSTT